MLRALLAASLLLNVFAIGAAGGWLVGRAGHLAGNERPMITQRAIRTAGQDLPPADRTRFEQAIGQVLVDGRALARTARRSRRDAAALFSETPFDQGNVAALLATARNADSELQARLDAAAIAFAASLPTDERMVLAGGLARGGPLRHAQPRPPP